VGKRARKVRTLGGQIRCLRQQRHLSRIALAMRLNVSRNLLRDIEEGIATPPIELLGLIAKALDVGVELFFEEAPAGRKE
jgi:transcriptional regulator with XRE-family HTH domain